MLKPPVFIVQEIGFCIFAIVLMAIASSVFSNMYMDTSLQQSITKDWEVKPLIDAIVISNTTAACPNEYETIFSRYWAGSSKGCYCKSGSITKKYWGKQLYRETCYTNDTFFKGCKDVKGIQGQPLDDFGGFKICGKRGGETFLNAQRVNAYGLCPSGYVLCNPSATNWDNRNCRRVASECPINYFSFSPEFYGSPNVVTREITPSLKLVISTQSDSLPLTQLQLSNGQPCIKQGEF